MFSGKLFKRNPKTSWWKYWEKYFFLSQKIHNLNLNPVVIRNKKNYLEFNNKNPKFNCRISTFEGRYGDVGLWATHYLALKKFIISEYKYLITIEDESVLFDNFFELLDKYIKEIPEDADIIYLDSPDSAVLCSYNKSYKYYKYNDIFWKSHHWFGGITIMFTKSGAQKIINYIENNIIEESFDYIILDSIPPKSNIFIFNKNIMVTLTGMLPKDKNKKFNTYSIAPNVQKLAGMLSFDSVIR